MFRGKNMKNGKMKCAMWTEIDRVEITEVDIPRPNDEEVLIKVRYAGICASDIHIIGGRLASDIIAPPRILGHEFSGLVEEVGANVTSCAVGDRVVAHPISKCGTCFFCRSGHENFCTNKKSIITGPYQGSFAEYT